MCIRMEVDRKFGFVLLSENSYSKQQHIVSFVNLHPFEFIQTHVCVVYTAGIHAFCVLKLRSDSWFVVENVVPREIHTKGRVQ